MQPLIQRLLLPLSLAVAAGTTAAPAQAGGRPDAVVAVLDSVDATWARVDGVTLESNPFRDKTRLCSDLEDVLKAERAKDRDRKRLAKALSKRIADAEDEGLAWRLHELHARVLTPLDADDARDALLAAVAAYPAVEYGDPGVHSTFHHLVNEALVAGWTTDGPEEAEARFLATLRDDRRMQAVYVEPLERHYVTSGAAARLEGLYASAAEALADRLPDVAAELAARPPLDVRYVDGDPRQLYLVLGSEVEAPGPRDLVVVMAGGSGQALDFLPWLRGLTEPLTDRYLFAVLSAPVWSDEQAEGVVWVTERWKREYGADFAVEDFARRAAAEVRASEPTLEQAFLFAWSSGGPATYATILDRDDTFAGAYVLASVFKPSQLDTKRAKGLRFYLEQGRSDSVTALHWAESAQRELSDKGAAVRFEPFDGGHGFGMPDPHRSLERALAWLSSDEE